ncbi:hypothetical protein GCWU000341_02864 [Oribacterium sp. oral taxon 078 str. F0262]|nr:hypothetical protein GCWU000341_02864 [Oribacterium sp. oral taxon 078 str. F0262]
MPFPNLFSLIRCAPPRQSAGERACCQLSLKKNIFFSTIIHRKSGLSSANLKIVRKFTNHDPRGFSLFPIQ